MGNLLRWAALLVRFIIIRYAAYDIQKTIRRYGDAPIFFLDEVLRPQRLQSALGAPPI